MHLIGGGFWSFFFNTKHFNSCQGTQLLELSKYHLYKVVYHIRWFYKIKTQNHTLTTIPAIRECHPINSANYKHFKKRDSWFNFPSCFPSPVPSLCICWWNQLNCFCFHSSFGWFSWSVFTMSFYSLHSFNWQLD